jgi:hypothetical protein
MEREIESLSTMEETMGIICVNSKGKIKKNVPLKTTRADSSSARSEATIEEIGKQCKKSVPIWWHAHTATLSTLSPEDRISGGLLKWIAGNDITCATGIEGYSCHVMDRSPPRLFYKKWGKKYFDKVKKSSISTPLLDLGKKWVLKKGKESNVHHLLCHDKANIVYCNGVDWNTGFAEFNVGKFHQVVITGNVDVMPIDGGFELLASPSDDALDCISIKGGNERDVLYCR